MAEYIKHIWWDLDGTLYHTPPEFEELKFNKRFELYSKIKNKPITENLKQEYIGLYEKCGSHSAVFVELGKPSDYWQTELQKIDLIPFLKPDQKTVDMFKKFSEMPYLHSIFTNRKIDYIEKLLSHLKIDYGLFKYIQTNDDLVNPKPHIEGYKE